MHKIITRAQQDPRRIVLPEGDNPVILRAAHQAAREGIAKPLLLGNEEKIRSLANELQVPLEGVEILDNFKSPLYDRFVDVLSQLRARKGWSLEETRRQLRSRFVFGSMMVLEGHVDGQVHGISRSYPDAIRPVLQVIPRKPGVSKVSGIYLMILKGRTLLLADTTVNFHPSAEDLAEIAILASEKAAFFDIKPRIAMVSFSNFGSTRHPDAKVVEEAVKLSRIKKPDLVIDGEMQADTALSEDIMKRLYPFSRLGGAANILIFPNLDAGNAAFKLLEHAGGAKAVGPLLMGMSKPFNVLQRSSDMENAVNVIAITVAQAQELATGVSSQRLS
jgi:malate dehydrogenase (oxaloacetate-decarboxylating)(NADP+)